MTKKLYSLALLLTVLITLSSTANSEEQTMNDHNAVLNAVQKMTDAFQQQDIKGVLTSYEPSAVVIFEPGKPIAGEQALQQMFAGAFQLNPQFDYPNGHEVYTAGDIALHIAPWVMKAKTPDGQNVEQRGLSIAVLRKQADGKWLLVLDNPHGQLLLK